MCFYADYDWYAEVCESEDRIAVEPLKCMECRTAINPGESYRYSYMQEHEQCQRCDDGVCDCIDWDTASGVDQIDHDCNCDKPAYGENYAYACCQECRKFLDAVERHELNEGCQLDEARPPLEMMVEYMRELDDLSGYFAEAEKMFPELRQSGYLDRMRELLEVEHA